MLIKGEEANRISLKNDVGIAITKINSNNENWQDQEQWELIFDIKVI